MLFAGSLSFDGDRKGRFEVVVEAADSRGALDAVARLVARHCEGGGLFDGDFNVYLEALKQIRFDRDGGAIVRYAIDTGERDALLIGFMPGVPSRQGIGLGLLPTGAGGGRAPLVACRGGRVVEDLALA